MYYLLQCKMRYQSSKTIMNYVLPEITKTLPGGFHKKVNAYVLRNTAFNNSSLLHLLHILQSLLLGSNEVSRAAVAGVFRSKLRS